MRDPQEMNLALGAKILWKIVSGDNVWWKQALQKKYMANNRRRCIENLDMRRVGSLVWELCKKLTYLIQENLYWEPRNGKYIKI